MRIRLFRKRQERAEWLKKAESAKHFIEFEHWLGQRRGGNAQQLLPIYLDELERHVKEAPTIVDLQAAGEVRTQVLGRLNSLNEFGLLFRTRRIDDVITINDKNIASIDVQVTVPLRLVNCTVRTITMQKDAGATLWLERSYVHHLELQRSSLRVFEVSKSHVAFLKCPLPRENSPFNGWVKLDRLSLKYDSGGRQSYRNMKHHLTEMHNLEAADVFHVAELRSLRHDQSGFDRLMNRFYWVASNYGASSARPLAWFALLATVNIGVLFYSDGTAVGVGNTENNWRAALVGDNREAGFLRAAVLTFSQIASPLGLFGQSSLVLAKTTLLAMFSMALSFLATTTLALAFLSIRRKFKFSSG